MTPYPAFGEDSVATGYLSPPLKNNRRWGRFKGGMVLGR